MVVDDLHTPCSPDDPAGIEMNWKQVKRTKLLETILTMSDMMMSLSTSKPTLNDEDIKKWKSFMS